MADICKCKAAKCNIKNKCLRFTVAPTDWQSYSDFSILGKKSCEYFIANNQTEIK